MNCGRTKPRFATGTLGEVDSTIDASPKETILAAVVISSELIFFLIDITF